MMTGIDHATAGIGADRGAAQQVRSRGNVE